MFRLALKSALARKGRLLLTALAVIAGCAFLSGVLVFSDTIRGSFDRLFANAYENTDAFVRSSNVIEGDFGAESRDRLPDSVIDEILTVPGVASAEGDIQGFARMSTIDGDDIGVTGPPTFGGVFSVSDASPWDLVDGTAPSGPDEAAIDRGSAKQADLDVGDQIDVTTEQGTRRVTVTGIVTFAGSDTSGGATWALFELSTAQEFVIGQPGNVDSVIVRSDGSVDDDALRDQLQAVFADRDIEVLTGQEITEENQSAVEEGLGFFTTFLSIFALISLFVSCFIIYNVFSISAAQRQRENALLRAIGASRSQVTRTLFLEAVIVGVLGGVLGFAGGVGLAAAINWVLSESGFGPSDSRLTVRPAVLVTSLLVGVVVTVACAIVPAIRAGRVPPLAAMRDVAVDHSAVSRRRLISGIVVLAVAAVGVGLGLTSDPVWLALGVVGMFVALVVLGPLVAAPVARVLTRPLAGIRGVTGEIAGRNARYSPKRTALTAGALAIGLALLIGVSTLGASVKTSIRAAIGEQFTGDFAVSTSDQGFGGLPPRLADEIDALPEVEAAAGIGIGLLNLIEDGEPAGKTVITVDATRAAKVFDIEILEGGWERLDASGIFVSEDKAERDGLALGSTVEAVFQDRSTRTLTVAGIIDSDLFGNLVVDRSLFEGQQTDLFDLQIAVISADGTDAADAESAIRAVTDGYPTAELQPRDEFIDDQVEQITPFLNFIYALLLISVFIAVLGIVITLLLSVYERRRELGLVRAVGMTRPQVRSSVRLEALITALLGSLFGLVLGLSLGWVVVQALRDEGLTDFDVSFGTIRIFIALAVGFALLAAWYPAWRAARADILDAIATT